MYYLILLVNMLAISIYGEIFTAVPSKLEEVVYMYPNQIREERDLPLCTHGEACGTEHKRYWFPPWVKRFCRCQKGECTKAGSKLDNRSHIKVCTGVGEECPGGDGCPDRCAPGEVGLELRRDLNQRTVIRLTCQCQTSSYWASAARIENSTLIHERYACLPLKPCKSGDFCGHIRSDTYSMYLRCGCPKDHICLNRERSERNITEALYQGPAMRAYCLPFQDNNVNTAVKL